MTFLFAWWREILIAVLVVMVLFQRERLNTKAAELDAWEIKAEAQQKDFDRRTKANQANKERTDADLAAAHKRIATLELRVKPGTPTVASKESFAAGNYKGPACINGRELYVGLGEVARRAADRASDLAAEAAKRAGSGPTRLAREVEQLAAAYRACQAYSLGLQ